MRMKAAIVVTTLVCVGLPLFWQTPSPTGAEEPRDERLEYKIIYTHLPNVAIIEAREVDGKLVQIEHGPAASAERMTQQFNELAEKGWVYVKVIGKTGNPQQGDGAGGLLTLFQRKKK